MEPDNIQFLYFSVFRHHCREILREYSLAYFLFCCRIYRRSCRLPLAALQWMFISSHNGLLGAMLTWIILNRRSVPIQIYILSPAGLIFAVILTIFQNIHGPPILVGALIALLMLRNDIISKNKLCY